MRVSGTFTITMKPIAPAEHAGRTAIGRISLDKQYQGALSASGKGEMMTAVTDTKGSAAYVALERITGTLAGRKGSFVVQHAGTMSAAKEKLSVVIVPDSGTEQLSGISGTLAIKIDDGQHVYVFDYLLPAPH
ncbi:DUF3224 domain-containing protein [Massilia glaciei]|uniref:DUF3224 domain-containing protein n=2 Tax=Massilia glaciei TaxID=1524097 RepID=A0A2U2HK44_9BURK|nr:DUF3224 domain-containing protein [Massilia glaciei]